ncbi:hypothetical protein [Pseudothermotoga thermarum]|uniref:Uncharacterized protein n=1 Tax=Pseudothermotoga thermarum DSM 5069 TaxID=688269 RepID=F7YUN5_9THEM|nr:hypothetical protein [Pseudothermotoga thermarum]AEH50220.1 hypothetical protein Theth_0116 [Pseudothermotoga thermarum DSM 5069]
MALVKSQVKRSVKAGTRTLVLSLPKFMLLLLFVTVVLAMGIPTVKLVIESAKLAQENRVLESRINEMQLQLKQLEELQALLLSKHEIVRVKDGE